MEAEIIKAVGDYGIQAVMLIWFMFRTEQSIKANTQALNNLEIVIKNFLNKNG